jgi:hypothetical protein
MLRCSTCTARPSVALLSTSQVARHWPFMVETSTRLHFTHQTETPPSFYIYILWTFSWLLQQQTNIFEHFFMTALHCFYYLQDSTSTMSSDYVCNIFSDFSIVSLFTCDSDLYGGGGGGVAPGVAVVRVPAHAWRWAAFSGAVIDGE